MAKLFSYDNPVWRFMGRAADVFFLTMLWALCSLPVITIGASTTALYYVSLKMVKNKEGYLWKTFLRAWKDNFVQSTLAWIIVLCIGGVLGFNLYFCYRQEGQAAVFLFWIHFMITVLYLFAAALLFPLAARLDADLKKLFLMSFMVSIKNFSWVLFMIVTTGCILALGIFVFWPFLLVGAGTAAYIHSLILEWIVFPKYGWNEEEKTD